MPPVLPYLRETASQTAGPFVHIGLLPSAAGLERHPDELGRVIAGPDTPGTRIALEGRVLDGAGAPATDVLIELWQADAQGLYAGHGSAAQDFRGFGRAATNFQTGAWRFDTIKPGRVTEPDGRIMAPHIVLWLAARGINIGLLTRLYFADEDEANRDDPVLAAIRDLRRRETLVAEPDASGDLTVYRLDIHLQGDHETVFFDV